MRSRILRAGKSTASSKVVGSTGLTRKSAWRRVVLPDSFWPTRQVTSLSTSNMSESSTDR
ncbi:hypothetical protein AQJ27_49565 [Streptomyces olivochromogenes]|nr:hypothetical protein AQJ27_49565 [Streptomyces olivochromogenes]